MKKQLMVVTAALMLSSGFAMAQTMAPSDGVMMKDGKVMVMKEGKTMMLDKDIMLKDGSKVMADGTVMKKDGSKTMMMNGDAMDMSGMMKK